MSARRGVALLVACYPRAWRDRYGEELADLVAASARRGRLPVRVCLDVVRGALREHVRGAGGPEARARSGVALTLWAWAIFVVAGVATQKHAEHWQDAVAGSRTLPGAAFGALVVAAVVAGLLVVAGIAAAFPAAVGLLGTRALRSRARVALALTATAAASLPAIVVWAHTLDAPARNGGDHAYAVAVACWAVLAAAALLAWTSVAAAVARHAALGPGTLRLEARLAAAVSAAMAAMTAATITWQVATGFGSIAEAVMLVAVMSTATAMGAAGAHRAVRAGASR